MEPRPHDRYLGRRLAASWSATEAAAVEGWHYRFAARTFAAQVAEEEWGRRLVTPGIFEPEWNHASGIAWHGDEVDERLARVVRAFTGRERTPAVVVTPWTAPADLDLRLQERGWRPRFKHLWSFFDLEPPIAVAPVAGYEYVRVGTASEMEEFVGVFVGVYGEDGRLDPGYAPALRRSLVEPGVRHHLIRHAGVPVAIGTLLVEGEISQILNMVVHDGHRRRGLAEWLLLERLREAREAGARRLTALSDNARIDLWLEQRGFVPGWFSVGYAPDPRTREDGVAG